MRVRQPPGVLGEIVARTVAAMPEPTPALASSAGPRDFVAALRAPGLSLIAEVKPRSPSAGLLTPSFDLERLCRAYADHAAAVSVLVDGPSFGGSYGLLAQVRARVPCPVLAKGFFVHESQLRAARAAGADAVLLMAAVLPPSSLARLRAAASALGMAALVEAHDAAELAEVLASSAPVVGVNSRDLATLQISLPRARQLLATVPPERVRVAESGLHTAADVAAVREVADAVLIGTALVRAEDPVAAICALGLGRSA